MEVDGGRDEVEGSSVGEDDGGDDVVVEVRRYGIKPDAELPVVAGIVIVLEESDSGSRPVGVGVVNVDDVDDGIAVEGVVIVMEER